MKRAEDQIVVRPEHPHSWLWEALEREPDFALRTMFGAKAIYLGERMMLCFAAKEEPWCGLLVCTDAGRQPALCAEFPALVPHPILPKWLYLSEACDAFEQIAVRLIQLVAVRDERIGILPKPKPRRKKALSARRKKSPGG